MGGGIGARAIPMSEIYAAQTGGVSANYMSRLVPAIFVANMVCVIFAGVLNGLGRGRFASLTGFSGGMKWKIFLLVAEGIELPLR